MSTRNSEHPEYAFRQRGLGLKLSVIGLEVDPGDVLTEAFKGRFNYEKLGSLVLPIIDVGEAGDPLEELLHRFIKNPRNYKVKAIDFRYQAIADTIAEKVKERGVVPRELPAILTRQTDNRGRFKRTNFGYGVPSAMISPMVQVARQQLGLPSRLLDVAEPALAPLATVYAIHHKTDQIFINLPPEIKTVTLTSQRFVAN